jgi:hypothetical protein
MSIRMAVTARLVLVAAGAMLLLVTAPATAADDVQEVRWFHADPDAVRTFVLAVADEPDPPQPAREIEVGKPTAERTENGTFYSAMIVMGLDEYVAVRAIGTNGLASARSSWGQPTPSQPGQPLILEP